MNRKIGDIVRTLASDPSVRGVILYRVDGTPIYANIRDERTVLSHLYFLESQIRTLLEYIFNQNLEEISIKVGNLKFLLLPVTRTLVLSILFVPVSEYRIEVESKRIINSLRPLLIDGI
ncbi:hypothetical protein GAH_01917 [Geoglobus ahangari]|uniref:Roadblock/LAMTOR2 domain-containing protein n=1 Tax=Geoglobus ahangari TaxID=113653 RepID=A0A0F7IDV1_9EURY|nr:hypothetical protein [Geoglobus ahangari]AKG90810.1 hypothetical protein GAH_01917 [Geoglobus ahangari]NOY11072.1 hypothetical protein [Archaeoglobi archaeon]